MLIQATCSIEALHRLNLEHISKVILLLHLTVVAKTMRFHLFEAYLNFRLLVVVLTTTIVVVHVGIKVIAATVI